MKNIGLILLASAALCTNPAIAQEPAAGAATASGLAHADGRDQAKTSGDHRELPCSKDNPYIEYRDCVNAHTRDRNAKVRMAEAASSVRRG